MTTIPSETLEALAAEIGEVVYIDIAKWHLYLNDAKLHTLLAEKLYPLLEDNAITQASILQVLQSTPIPVGGGRTTLPLLELIPTRCESALLQALEDFQAKYPN